MIQVPSRTGYITVAGACQFVVFRCRSEAMMRDARQASGLFLALLALVAQLTMAAAVPASAVSLASVAVLCQHDGSSNAPPAPAHQSPDCLLCFFCHSAMGPVGLLAAAPLLPTPTTSRIVRSVVLPPATAPPVRVALAARPRGPPILA
jgi:hypothetical protein